MGGERKHEITITHAVLYGLLQQGGTGASHPQGFSDLYIDAFLAECCVFNDTGSFILTMKPHKACTLSTHSYAFTAH